MYKRVIGRYHPKAHRSSSSAGLARLLLNANGRARSWGAVALPLVLAACLLYYQFGTMKHLSQLQIDPVLGGRQCVGWKETLFCHPSAEHYQDGDKPCDAVITGTLSGYCLCEGNVTTARVACGPKHFTCQQKCMELGINPEEALPLPKAITCPYKVTYQASNFLAGKSVTPSTWRINAAVEREKVAPVWQAVWAAVHRHSLSDVHAPAVRNFSHDFVREGRYLPKSVVEHVRLQVAGFKAEIPPYPAHTYSGKGIVIVGGGLKYITPAWVAVHQLRMTGCRLPIEMWFPVSEAPTEAAAAVLREIGVTVRLLDFHGLTSFNPYKAHKHDKDSAGSPKAAPLEDKKELLKWHNHQKQQHKQKKAAVVGQPDLRQSIQRALLDQHSLSPPAASTQRALLDQQPQPASSNAVGNEISSTGAGGTGSSTGSSTSTAISQQQQQQQQQQQSLRDPQSPQQQQQGAGPQQQQTSSSAGGQQGPADDDDPEHLARFTIKVAALVLSSFEEVLYLDADNIAVKDPSFLFSSPGYNRTGALMWQDYWDNTIAPQVADMLALPRSRWYRNSFESGQMLVDKSQHWQGLMVAVYLNSYAAFWYEMLSCFLGKGDKDTFAYGMLAAGEDIDVVPKPPGSVGTTGTSLSCNRRTSVCKDEFTGNTMNQHSPSGDLLFMHSNMHKWDMQLPDDFDTYYQRRWQHMLPEGIDFVPYAQQLLGYDLERQVYDFIRQLKCQPWWEDYYQIQLAKGDQAYPQLDGFHLLVRGIELDKLYIRGWKGNYYPILLKHKDITLWNDIQHWWWYNVRPVGVRWGVMQPI